MSQTSPSKSRTNPPPISAFDLDPATIRPMAPSLGPRRQSYDHQGVHKQNHSPSNSISTGNPSAAGGGAGGASAKSNYPSLAARTAAGLSLGKLPSPNIMLLPSGQRSVPVIQASGPGGRQAVSVATGTTPTKEERSFFAYKPEPVGTPPIGSGPRTPGGGYLAATGTPGGGCGVGASAGVGGAGSASGTPTGGVSGRGRLTKEGWEMLRSMNGAVAAAAAAAAELDAEEAAAAGVGGENGASIRGTRKQARVWADDVGTPSGGIGTPGAAGLDHFLANAAAAGASPSREKKGYMDVHSGEHHYPLHRSAFSSIDLRNESLPEEPSEEPTAAFAAAVARASGGSRSAANSPSIRRVQNGQPGSRVSFGNLDEHGSGGPNGTNGGGFGSMPKAQRSISSTGIPPFDGSNQPPPRMSRNLTNPSGYLPSGGIDEGQADADADETLNPGLARLNLSQDALQASQAGHAQGISPRSGLPPRLANQISPRLAGHFGSAAAAAYGPDGYSPYFAGAARPHIGMGGPFGQNDAFHEYHPADAFGYNQYLSPVGQPSPRMMFPDGRQIRRTHSAWSVGDFGGSPRPYSPYSPVMMPPATIGSPMPAFQLPPTDFFPGIPVSEASAPYRQGSVSPNPAMPNYLRRGQQQQQQQQSGMMRPHSMDFPAGMGPFPGNTPSPMATVGPQFGSGGFQPVQRPEDRYRVSRSPLLEEFRSTRNRKWELTDIVNHVLEFSSDQLGSRHIQQKLETATLEEKRLVFEEILPNVLALSVDVFANYVVQKFFEQGTDAQRSALADALTGHVLRLSLQMYGCRVVQKALECVGEDQQVALVTELDGHVLKCAKDMNANHVIQRALEKISPPRIKFVPEACVTQVYSLATHPYGCRVLQRVFENCPISQTRGLLDELHRYTQNLMQDQYGNYVIQWILEHGPTADRSSVVSKVLGQVLHMSRHKFASNVVEKCVVFATDEERRQLTDEILAPKPDGSSTIGAMLKDQFANYPLQKFLTAVEGDQRELLIAKTTQQLVNLRKYSSAYSKHLIAIEKLLVAESKKETPGQHARSTSTALAVAELEQEHEAASAAASSNGPSQAPSVAGSESGAKRA